MILEGLRSRWMIPFWWACCTAWQTCTKSSSRSPGPGGCITVLGNGDAPHQFHHEVGPTGVRRAAIEDLGHIRVVHQGQGLPFRFETGDDVLGVHAELDNLQGHLAADRLLLLGHVDHGHAAFPDLLQQLVPVDDRARAFTHGGCVERLRAAQGWDLKEITGLLVCLEQGFEMRTQIDVAATGFVQVPSPLFRSLLLPCFREDAVLDSEAHLPFRDPFPSPLWHSARWAAKTRHEFGRFCKTLWTGTPKGRAICAVGAEQAAIGLVVRRLGGQSRILLWQSRGTARPSRRPSIDPRCAGISQHLSRLREGQTGEVAHFHELGRQMVLLGQPFQSRVQGDHVLWQLFGRHFRVVQINPLETIPVFHASLASSIHPSSRIASAAAAKK